MRTRIEWWWTGIVEWLLDRPFAVRETARGAVGCIRRRWWRVTDAGLDLLGDLRGRPREYAIRALTEVEEHQEWRQIDPGRHVSVLYAEAELLDDLPRAASA